ncbi:coiled-coil domain-containing protein 77 [Paragonimus westermani]|uniref:Coiled-coil domain-containing protein 77 n=1 Tax=Paragonimus westermani TaxID=34504 RepID=A0A5J4NGI1_9TREM|nr:coiled-coil domain-containing protein 77 [Paragonimus westermani]
MSVVSTTVKLNQTLKRSTVPPLKPKMPIPLQNSNSSVTKKVLRQQNPLDGSVKEHNHNPPAPGCTDKGDVSNIADAVDARLSQLTDPTNELLSYYRRKVESLADDHELVQRRLDQIADAMKNQDSQTWEIRQRETEIGELQRTLSDMQVYLFQEREHVLRLYAENDRLKIRELDDRRKIQHLLQLSGLGPAEVTYFLRDPGTDIPQAKQDQEDTGLMSGEYNPQSDVSTSRANIPQSTCVSGLVVAPIIPITPEQGVMELTASGKTIRRLPRHSSTVGHVEPNSDRHEGSSRATVSRLEHESVLRELEMTKAAVRALRTQLTEQARTAREQNDSLMDDLRATQEEVDTLRKRYDERLRLAEEQLKRSQALLYDSTKDFLAQRSQFKQAEKVWITEKDKLLSQLEAKRLALVAVPNKLNSNRQPVSNNLLETNWFSTAGDLESRAWSEAATQLAQKKQDQLQQTLRNLEHQLDQQQKLSDMYREQVIQLEEELVRCREEGIVSKDVLKDNSDKLSQRLQIMTNRYRDLERRRQLEMQGYRTDIGTLRKKLREVEKQLLKLTLGLADGMELPSRPQDVDLAILKQVKASTDRSNQLMSELKNLKLKMYTLEDDLRKI